MSALHKVFPLAAEFALKTHRAPAEVRLGPPLAQLARPCCADEPRYERQSETLGELQRRAEIAAELAAIAALAAGLAREIGATAVPSPDPREPLGFALPDARGQLRLRLIRAQLQRLCELLQGSLELGRPPEEPQTRLDLQEVLRESVRGLAEDFQVREISVKLAAAAPAFVLGRALRLQRAFRQLFQSAIEVIPHGGELRLELRCRPDGVRVRVGALGWGLAPGALDRVSDPLAIPVQNIDAGRALGLRVARAILREHGGRIDVADGRGEGTEFLIRLPAA